MAGALVTTRGPGDAIRGLARGLLVLWSLLLFAHPLAHSRGIPAESSFSDGCGTLGHHHLEHGHAAAECAICLIQHLPREVVVPAHVGLLQVVLPLADPPTPHLRNSQPPQRLARAPPDSPARSFC